MKEYLRTFLRAVLAGLCISVGGTVYLMSESRILGAALFTVGLFTICVFGFDLFTGKACYLPDRGVKLLPSLLVIWLGNLAGTFLVGTLELCTRNGAALRAAAETVAAAKLGDGILSIFILSFFCNMLIYIAVENFARNPHELGKYVALFLGVMGFIFCGFEHCVANMYYFTVAGAWSLRTLGYLAVMSVGNALGGMALHLLKKLGVKSQTASRPFGNPSDLNARGK